MSSLRRSSCDVALEDLAPNLARGQKTQNPVANTRRQIQHALSNTARAREYRGTVRIRKELPTASRRPDGKRKPKPRAEALDSERKEAPTVCAAAAKIVKMRSPPPVRTDVKTAVWTAIWTAHESAIYAAIRTAHRQAYWPAQ